MELVRLPDKLFLFMYSFWSLLRGLVGLVGFGFWLDAGFAVLGSWHARRRVETVLVLFYLLQRLLWLAAR